MDEYGLIKIFNQLYVGFQERYRSEEIILDASNGDVEYKQIPYRLGFVTPYEDSAAGRKRQSTVDSWANTNQYRYERQPDGSSKYVKKEQSEDLKPQIIKNEQLKGFKLAEEVKRTYWGGGNVVWRIEDPRGFEIEISSANLARIISEVGILSGGVIPGKCIYGRLGKDNILIPEGTALWNRSVKDAEELDRKSKTVGKTQVVPGSICEMKNGSELIYLGQFWITDVRTPRFEDERYSGYSGYYTPTLEQIMSSVKSDKYTSIVQRYHAFKNKTSPQIYLYREKKVISVNGSDSKFENIDANMQFINSIRQISYAGAGKYTYSTVAIVATIEKPEDFSFDTVALTPEEIEKSGVLNKWGTLQFKINPNDNNYDVTVINELGEMFNTMKVLFQRGDEIKDGKYGYTKYIATNLKVVTGSKINISEKSKTCNTKLSNSLGYGYLGYHVNNKYAWNYIANTDNSIIADAREILQQAVEEFKSRHSLFKVVVKVGNSQSLMYSR